MMTIRLQSELLNRYTVETTSRSAFDGKNLYIQGNEMDRCASCRIGTKHQNPIRWYVFSPLVTFFFFSGLNTHTSHSLAWDVIDFRWKIKFWGEVHNIIMYTRSDEFEKRCKHKLLEFPLWFEFVPFSKREWMKECQAGARDLNVCNKSESIFLFRRTKNSLTGLLLQTQTPTYVCLCARSTAW